MAVTTSNGDGYALYNGVKLPNIDSVWDKTKYPYAFIMVYDGSAFGPTFEGMSMWSLYLSSSRPQLNDADNMVEIPSPYSIKIFLSPSHEEMGQIAGGLLPGSWAFADEDESDTNSSVGYDNSMSPVMWTNTDILNVSDNSTYLAASDPIPLDGMTVIEWDGDMSGREVGTYAPIYPDGVGASFTVYRVADYMPLRDGDVYAVIMGNMTGAGIIGDDYYQDYEPVFGNGGRCHSYQLISAPAGTYTVKVGTLDNVIDLPKDGLYMYSSSDGLGRTTLYAYPAGETDKPSYDKTTFLSGMAMGLTGKGYPAGANGHMSYNGIELADINSIWTDKSNHVFICEAADNSNASYFAIVSTVAPYQDSVNGGVSLSAPFYFKQYGCFTDEALANQYGTTAYTWTYYQDHSLDEGVSNFDQTVIWTSTDIRKDSDGSVFLAASEPFPAGGIGGNDDFTKGYLVGAELRAKRRLPAAYLYNGVKLPKLPEWDKETYPYAYITGNISSGAYYLHCTVSVKTAATGGRMVFAEGAIHYKVKDGLWVEHNIAGLDPVVWSNTDVYYSDSVEEVGGTLYLAASEPVPVYE